MRHLFPDIPLESRYLDSYKDWKRVRLTREFGSREPTRGEPERRDSAACGQRTLWAAGSAVPRVPREWGRGDLAKEWRQRNGDEETFGFHSFASIPLPKPFRGLGFRFRSAKTRSPERCLRRHAENPSARLLSCRRRREENSSAETVQHGAIVPENGGGCFGRRIGRWAGVSATSRRRLLGRLLRQQLVPPAAHAGQAEAFAGEFELRHTPGPHVVIVRQRHEVRGVAPEFLERELPAVRQLHHQRRVEVVEEALHRVAQEDRRML